MNKIGRNDLCPCGSKKKFKNCCQQAKNVHPSSPQNLSEINASLNFFDQAMRLHRNGKLEEAADLYKQGIALHPTPEMLSNLGNVLDSVGKASEAIAAYQKALALKPDMVEVHNNLALSLQEQGDHDAALKAYQKALSLRPDFAPVYFNLGRLQQLRGEHQAAINSYKKLLDIHPDHAQAYNNLANAYEELGEFDAAVKAYQHAIKLSPDLVAAQNGLSRVLSRVVPLWHVPMMNDRARNEAYYAALRAAITPHSHVFEIGTGSGLLSMMAAKLGAAQVTTCEAEPLIAETAKRIIAQNGLSDRIKQISKKSTDMQCPTDLSQPADILVSEIFSSEVLGERVLSSLEDTKRRLLAVNAKIIPAKATIMIALFGGDEIGSNLIVGEVCGFDLSAFNSIVSHRQTVARNDLPVQMLSEDMEAFTFDFQGENEWPAENKVLHIPVKVAGQCLGIIQWMHLQMDDHIEFENHPSVIAAASSWTRCTYLLPIPKEVTPGQIAIVEASHNRTYPWFRITGFEEAGEKEPANAV